MFARQGKFFVRDLGSTNTTRVNGEIATGPSRELYPGDELEVGDVLLRCEVDSPSRTPCASSLRSARERLAKGEAVSGSGEGGDSLR